MNEAQTCVVIGAGPAGLTAGWELAKSGHKVEIFERGEIVGGISRTESYKGFRYDIGGHRFFTKVQMVHDWWMDILEADFIKRPRLSRIFYKGVFFDYPLKPMNALLGLGIFESFLCGMSYLKAQAFPSKNEATFEDWVSNRFGKRLFNIFFKTYTEKVWGMSCSELSADWAAQRIKDLDLLKAVKSAIFRRVAKRGKVITSLIEEFHYPRLGPGMMWEKVQALLEENQHGVYLRTDVTRVHHDGARVVAVTVRNAAGEERRVSGDQFLSTTSIRELLHSWTPAPPPEVLAAANRLRYRDFLTVGLIVDQKDTFPDNWIYIHSPEVKVGRIQNFKAWSPEMVPDDTKSSIGLEYFVQENDAIWSASDEDLIKLGREEVDRLGLISADKVTDGCVIRVPKAYPVYDDVYKECVDTVRNYLGGFPNIQLIGRNGQHRYNNQDHSMVTAIYAARNICGANYSIWDVNVDQEYHEADTSDDKASPPTGDRQVPKRVERDPVLELLAETFCPYDSVALGVAVGVVAGVGLFLASAILILKGGDPIGPTLSLLGNYLLGYSVTWGGALVGLVEGAVAGFAVGWLLGQLNNAVIRFHARRILIELSRQISFEAMSGE